MVNEVMGQREKREYAEALRAKERQRIAALKALWQFTNVTITMLMLWVIFLTFGLLAWIIVSTIGWIIG